MFSSFSPVNLCALGLALLSSSCSLLRPTDIDATVLVHSEAGDELGVATEFGVVFLGRGQSSGEVEYTVFFGDGPSRERATIEPLATGIFNLEPELRLPTTEIGFPVLEAGDEVVVRGRRGREAWERSAQVAVNPHAEGLLLKAKGLGDLGHRDTGAGVYVAYRGRHVLVGLVQGRVSLPGKNGAPVSYIAVAGARELVGLGLHGLPRTPPRVPSDRQDALR